MYKNDLKLNRIHVPKALKDRLWDITFGPEAGQGKCYVCDTIINSKVFEAGHIISVHHNGLTILDNLKCICSTCNKSMGTRNLEDFKRTYFPAIRKIKKNKCECCCHKQNSDLIQKSIEPFNEPFNKPFNEPFNKPFNEPFNEPFNKPFNEPFNKPFNEPLIEEDSEDRRIRLDNFFTNFKFNKP